MNVNLKVFDLENGIDIPYNDLCDLVYNAITAAVASKSTNDPLSWEGHMREELDDLCATIQSSEALDSIARHWIKRGYGFQWFGEWPGVLDADTTLRCSTGFVEIDEVLEEHSGVIAAIYDRTEIMGEDPPADLADWLAWVQDEIIVQQRHIEEQPEGHDSSFLKDLQTVEKAISEICPAPAWKRTTWAGVQDNDTVCIDNYQDGEFPNANPKISGPYKVRSAERRLLQRDDRAFMHYGNNLIKYL